jgi:hypothetical protein
MHPPIKTGTQNPASNADNNSSPSTAKPMSVRESIANALKEETSKIDDTDDNEDNSSKVEDKKPVKKPLQVSSDLSDLEDEEDEDEDEELDNKEDEVEETDDEDDIKKEPVKKPVENTTETAFTPPVGWTKEAKAEYSKLPPETKSQIKNMLASVAKREKEVSQGFAEYGAKVKGYEQLDQVLAPRMQTIQSLGRTPAETVDKMFKWFEAFAAPDQSRKVQAFTALAKSFNIDVAKAFQQPSQTPNDGTQSQEQTQQAINPELEQLLSEMANRISGFEQQTVSQRQQAAENEIQDWAKDKPHFEKLRPAMFALFQSGVIPIVGNKLDLDAAYQKALRLDDELFAIYQEEQREAKRVRIAAKKAKIAAKKAKEEAENTAKIAKARNAGSSLKPQSRNNAPPELNGKQPQRRAKPISVRESIEKAIAESKN